MRNIDPQNSELCCYCGIRIATTKDHIPPKGIFNRPRPSDLITVPSCFECNNKASNNDEKFKAYLGMHIARHGGQAERLFKEGVLPTAKYNTRLRNNILETMYPVLTATKSGIITGKGIAVPWDNVAHDFTMQKVIRGLFYHHYKRVIAENARIKIYWVKSAPAGFENMLYSNAIADGQFQYMYNKVEESDFDSIWLFNFYNAHFAGGIVSSET
ncbi:MAG: hypothetical protein QM768_12185 [Agriterribacter sp.]